MPTPDDIALAALHQALAEEHDPKRLQTLLLQLDRLIDNQITRARVTPDVERR